MKRTLGRKHLDRAASLPRALLGALYATALLLLAGPAFGAGACSPQIGRATLNEYNHQDKFVEVKQLDVAADMTGWKVRVYSKSGNYAQREFPATSDNACDEYHVFDFGAASKDADIVLLDGNDDVIDILRVRTAPLPVATAFYTPYPGCDFPSPPTDLQIDAQRKGVDRIPDGVGWWRNTPGVGDNSYATRCGGNASTGAPSSFNAFEPDTAAGATTGVIRTKRAGSAFSLDVVAISGGAQDALFNGEVKVELLGNTTTGVGLDGRNCPVSATPFTESSATLSDGRGKVFFADDPKGNAWKDVRVRIGYPASAPTVFACSNDNFAIRPERFEGVIVSDADSSSAGTSTVNTRILDNTDANGGVVHKAGRPFALRAAVVPATAGNYTGTPSAVLSACADSGCPAVLGNLSVGSGAVSAVIDSTTATYSEVGAFRMQLQDQTFASVDAGDTDGDCSATGRYVCSTTVNVGRFVPDHFDLVAANTPVFKTFNDTTCDTRSFTYVGQPFGYATLPQATITAKNAGGGVTVNYAGALWKLVASGVTESYAAVTGTPDTGGVLLPEVTKTGTGSGTLTLNAADRIAFLRSLPLTPFSADINLTLSIVDSAEADTGVSGNEVIETATPAQFADIAFDSGDEIRFGRLVVRNAHGSELLPLPVVIETQHWTAAGFVRNAADFCTQLAANHVALSNWQRKLDLCETAPALSGRFNAGRGNLRFGAPGQNNSGSVDLVVRLDGAGGGSTCVGGTTTPAVGADQSWLRGRWSGGGYDQNPAARASFGLHRGSRAQIYVRELY